jgi:hypothetical protein
MTIIGILFGVGISVLLDNFGIFDFIGVDHVYVYVLFGIIFGILLFILTPKLIKIGEKIILKQNY